MVVQLGRASPIKINLRVGSIVQTHQVAVVMHERVRPNARSIRREAGGGFPEPFIASVALECGGLLGRALPPQEHPVISRHCPEVGGGAAEASEHILRGRCK